MTIRDKIRVLANSKGMSLPALEVALGFGNGTIVRWDKSSPTAEKLQKVADYFGVSVDYLLGREEKTPTQEGERGGDPDIRRIERARKNMSETDRQKMMNILKASFDDYFSDDYEDDDLNE